MNAAARTLTLSAVAMLLLTAAGLLASVALIAREHSRTRDALLRERHRAREAGRNFRQARGALDSLTRVTSEEMEQPQVRDLLVELLQAWLSYGRQLIEQHKDDPTTAVPASAGAGRIQQKRRTGVEPATTSLEG